jgi:hypothetical protein
MAIHTSAWELPARLPERLLCRILLHVEDQIMAESSLTLTGEERDYLVKMLEGTLKDTRIEEHRTRMPSYREFVLNEEQILEGLLKKLGHLPG